MPLRALAEIIFPTSCVSCSLPGRLLCDLCDRALERAGPIGCERCGHPWPLSVARCPQCPGQLRSVRHAVAYHGPARELIRALKFDQMRAVADLLGDLIVSAVPRPVGVLVPVAACDARLRERGFNQAELIARAAAAHWGIEVAGLMSRSGAAVTQRGASVTVRQQQVRGVFRACTQTVWPHVTLVDDVMTTGATVAACARALRRAGAGPVDAIVVARVCVPGAAVAPS